MITAPLPDNESERLEALERYDILDTPPEEEFDGITRLIARICDVPFAVINLVASGRQWFKSEIGFGVRQTPLDTSFCAHAILQEDFLIVPDTTRDPRFDCNPLVTGEPRLRFYAGALLKTADGHALGTLCVLDTEPRQLGPDQIDSLQVLARQVMQLLELRRELKRKNELATKLNEALLARERILAVVSHDLRNPLNTIALTAAQLSAEAERDRHRRTAERLTRATVSMQRLVDDLLDLESLDRNELSLEHEEVQAGQLIASLQQAFEVAAESRGVRIERRIVDDPRLCCDVERMLQALGNLVSNALDFTPRGGAITLGCRVVGGQLALSVRDAGPGFDANVVGNLFEPFWRGSGDRKRGVGLGLSITRRIVEAHGGTVSARATPGRGATFTVCLPLAASLTSP